MITFKKLALVLVFVSVMYTGRIVFSGESEAMGKLWMEGKPGNGPSEIKTLDFDSYQVRIDSYGNIISIKSGDTYMMSSKVQGDIAVRLRADYIENGKTERLEQCAWGSLRSPMKFYISADKENVILKAVGGSLGANKISAKPISDILKYSQEMVFGCDGVVKIRYEITSAGENIKKVHVQLKVPLIPEEKLTVQKKGASDKKEIVIPEEANDYYLPSQQYQKISFTNPPIEIATISTNNFLYIQDPRTWAKSGPNRFGETSAYLLLYAGQPGPKYVIEFIVKMKIPYGEMPELGVVTK